VTLEPQVAEDDFVHQCLNDEEGKAFLVQGSHVEGEWCCDVCDYPGSQWSTIQCLSRNPLKLVPFLTTIGTQSLTRRGLGTMPPLFLAVFQDGQSGRARAEAPEEGHLDGWPSR
jgi:hypothetical protein